MDHPAAHPPGRNPRLVPPRGCTSCCAPLPPRGRRYKGSTYSREHYLLTPIGPPSSSFSPSFPTPLPIPHILRNRSSREGVMGVVPAEISPGNGVRGSGSFPYCLLPIAWSRTLGIEDIRVTSASALGLFIARKSRLPPPTLPLCVVRSEPR